MADGEPRAILEEYLARLKQWLELKVARGEIDGATATQMMVDVTAVINEPGKLTDYHWYDKNIDKMLEQIGVSLPYFDEIMVKRGDYWLWEEEMGKQQTALQQMGVKREQAQVKVQATKEGYLPHLEAYLRKQPDISPEERRRIYTEASSQIEQGIPPQRNEYFGQVRSYLKEQGQDVLYKSLIAEQYAGVEREAEQPWDATLFPPGGARDYQDWLSRKPKPTKEAPAEKYLARSKEEAEAFKERLAFLGAARGIPEPGRSWAQQRKAESMGKYWDWARREFPEAGAATYPFLEGLKGGSTFQQWAKGRAGELTRQYEKPRQEWWGGMHKLPIETPVGFRGFPEFYEWQRRERERDPLKMALEKEITQEEFLKLPPRRRGFYPGRIAPPARWY